MNVGVHVTVDGRAGHQRAHLRDLARLVEDLGFDSLWMGDHIVEFAEYSSRHPYRASGRHPSTERGTPGRYEPFLALTAVAAWTERLRLGTAVALLTERNPLLTAAMTVTLDHLAAGRFVLGVGVGWLREEHEALGVPFSDRGRRCDEYLEAMARLWEDDVSTYRGRYVEFDGVLAYPKPLTHPRPPLVVGGASDAALRRTVRFADGWLPVFLEGAALQERLHKLRELAVESGRDPDDLTVEPMYVLDDPGAEVQAGQAARHVADCERLGVDGVIFKPRMDGTSFRDVLPALAQAAGIG